MDMMRESKPVETWGVRIDWLNYQLKPNGFNPFDVLKLAQKKRKVKNSRTMRAIIPFLWQYYRYFEVMTTLPVFLVHLALLV